MRFKERRETLAWRLVFSALVFGVTWVVAEYLELAAFFWSSNDAFAAAVMLVITPLLLATWLGWYSRSVFSAGMLIPAFLFLYALMSQCIDWQGHGCDSAPIETRYVVMASSSLLGGWALGYLVGRRWTSWDAVLEYLARQPNNS
jgi:hypothetical protein